MRVLTKSDLTHRSSEELTMLFNRFNNALLLAKPMSTEWRQAQAGIDNVLRMRAARCQRIGPRPF